MVFINYNHINKPGKKGYIGGCARCMCLECVRKRKEKSLTNKERKERDLDDYRDRFPEMFRPETERNA